MLEIAVVMAAYIANREQLGWLGEAVQSVLHSTFKSVELVLVDDGSPIALPPTPDGVPVRYLRMAKQSGPAAARNVGVRMTAAPWIFCLDSDDRLKPDALEKLYAMRDANQYTYGDLEWTGKRSGVMRIADWSMAELRKCRGPIGVTALQSRRLWQALGGWREDLIGLEDIEYWLRAAECGITGKHIPEIIFEYRIHDASRTRSFTSNGSGKAMVDQIYAMHKDFLEKSTPSLQIARKDIPVVNGKVQVVYVGPKSASFPIPGGAPSGERYQCEGHGHRFFVREQDLDWLMLFLEGGGPAFRVVVSEPQVQPVIQPAIDFSQVPIVRTEMPDVTTMHWTHAVKAVEQIDSEPDLRVVEALENGTAKRPAVLKAIEKRREELAG